MREDMGCVGVLQFMVICCKIILDHTYTHTDTRMWLFLYPSLKVMELCDNFSFLISPLQSET